MNQPNLPVMANRPAAAPEATDMLVALRRYLWLLIMGAMVGGGVGTGLYMYTRSHEPRFTAHIPFQVLPPPAHVGEGQGASSYYNQDDVSQLIHRQAFLFEQDSFLDEVLRSDEFHTNPGDPGSAGNGESTWLRDNKADPLRALKRDLSVVPRLNAATFDISMTARDPYEALQLVIAAAKVYRNKLDSDNTANKAKTLSTLAKATQDKKTEWDVASQELADWAKARNIDVARSRFEIERNALQALNEEAIRTNALAVTANAQFKLIDGLLASARVGDADGDKITLNADKVNDIQLTPEVEQSIENDPVIRNLDSEKLSWIQEQRVEESKTVPNKARQDDINHRLEIIAKQRDQERGRLKTEYATRMWEQAKNDATSKLALTNSVEDQRKRTEGEVRTIGQDLMEYQQKLDQLNQKQQLYYNISNQFAIASANKGTDDTRVQQFADAVRPTVMSSPNWVFYIPVGTGAGLLLSGILAYLLFLTDTRVRTPRDISRSLQLSLLGFVPDEGDDRTLTGDVETAILSSPASMVAESFRQIRSHVTAQTAHNPVNTLLVASIAPGGGSTTVAANLAAAMALNDIRVLLVDANFYRPGISRIANNVPASGLAEALNDPTILESCIAAHPSLPKLHLMGAGSELAGASSELFEGRAFRELVEKLKSRYDMILFDGAPLNLVSDSLALAARVDGVIPVVRAGEVSRGTVARVRDQLRNVHANLLGFVLNAVQTNNSGYFKENYRTYFRYAGQGRRAVTPK